MPQRAEDGLTPIQRASDRGRVDFASFIPEHIAKATTLMNLADVSLPPASQRTRTERLLIIHQEYLYGVTLPL